MERKKGWGQHTYFRLKTLTHRDPGDREGQSKGTSVPLKRVSGGLCITQVYAEKGNACCLFQHSC